MTKTTGLVWFEDKDADAPAWWGAKWNGGHYWVRPIIDDYYDGRGERFAGDYEAIFVSATKGEGTFYPFDMAVFDSVDKAKAAVREYHYTWLSPYLNPRRRVAWGEHVVEVKQHPTRGEWLRRGWEPERDERERPYWKRILIVDDNSWGPGSARVVMLGDSSHISIYHAFPVVDRSWIGTFHREHPRYSDLLALFNDAQLPRLD